MNKKDLIFMIYKDVAIDDILTFKALIMKKYHLNLYDAHDLYVKINNYQIDTYGSSLYSNDEFVTKEEYHRRNNNSKSRRYNRRA